MMTRKHFKEMARLLKEQRPCSNANAIAQWEMDVQAMADFCRGMNPAFNRDIFLEICGYPVKQEERKKA